MHQALEEFQIQDHHSCGEAHGIVVTQIAQNQKDTDSLWSAHRELQGTVNKILITIAKIVGAGVAIQTVAFLLLQIYLKH